ncbi:MAG: DUF5063 domain-containing protein [Bacteroidales bacterium]
MESQEEMIKSRKVLEFLTVANEYCLLIDRCKDYPRESLLEILHRILPLVYLKGSLLPEITPGDEELLERFVTEEQWEDRLNELREILEGTDQYWDIHHPEEKEPENHQASVAEDLADLYQEMKDFVLLYQKPLTAAKENAVAACRQYFADHWGRKALKACLIIHQHLHPCSHDHHDHH